mmetsp:Transcript_45072/g.107107  ORF Transcript_45072/g.107107 Transcript_45072/m.107107 type:complete len:348 (+) Transcript_45072:74-1117(+)
MRSLVRRQLLVVGLVATRLSLAVSAGIKGSEPPCADAGHTALEFVDRSKRVRGHQLRASPGLDSRPPCDSYRPVHFAATAEQRKYGILPLMKLPLMKQDPWALPVVTVMVDAVEQMMATCQGGQLQRCASAALTSAAIGAAGCCFLGSSIALALLGAAQLRKRRGPPSSPQPWPGSQSPSTAASSPRWNPTFAAPLREHFAAPASDNDVRQSSPGTMQKAQSMPHSSRSAPRTPRKKLVPDPRNPSKWTYIVIVEPESAPALPQVMTATTSAQEPQRNNVARSSARALQAQPQGSSIRSSEATSSKVAESLSRLGAVAERRRQFEAWQTLHEERRLKTRGEAALCAA